MTTEKRKNPVKFTPVEGKIYENAGGGRYICLAVLSDREAKVQNTVSGWTCCAHGIVRYENGTIEWDYSTGGHFAGLPEPAAIYSLRRETAYRQRSMMNAMLCCLI